MARTSPVRVAPPPEDAGAPLTVAVLIPCLNEARTVGKVVKDFRRELPDAAIWVIDNGSSDATALLAAQAGAGVITEPRRGKGFAVRSGFRDVDADVYVLADGDDQTPAESVNDLVEPIIAGRADMVVGSRALAGHEGSKPVNDLGNRLFSALLRLLLGVQMTDVLSGYRALSSYLVKGMPLSSRNFEVEVELTIKTTQRSYRLTEIPIRVRQRPAGSAARLRVLRDGFRILWAIALLVRDYRPMAFFTAIALVVGLFAVATLAVAGQPLGYVVGTVLGVGAVACLAVGAVLSTLARRFTELEGKVDLAVTRGRVERSPDDRGQRP